MHRSSPRRHILSFLMFISFILLYLNSFGLKYIVCIKKKFLSFLLVGFFFIMLNYLNIFYAKKICFFFVVFNQSFYVMKRKPKLSRRVIKSFRCYKIVTDVYSYGLIRWYNGLNRWLEFKSPFWHLGCFYRQMCYSSVYPILSMFLFN